MLLTTKISRPLLIVIFVVLALLSLFLLTPHPYNPTSSLPSLISPFKSSPKVAPPTHYDDDLSAPGASPRHRENATFVMLARNVDVEGAVDAVRKLEDRFNRNFNYPWVFLNDEPFSDDFKRRVSNVVSGPAHFGQIPEEHWHQPPWIDEAKATEERRKMIMAGVPYSESISYRNMCRFNSGFFFRHPLVQDFRYYWRVEPHVHFHCDVDFDPFTYLRENNKTYGFTLSLYDYQPTLPTLWSAVKDFINTHPEYVVPNNAMRFISDDGGDEFNLCIFYNNLEIADMDLWRSEAYLAYFDHLDHQGGFYYERWGDAPVHTIAAALFAGADKIHFFRDIGYQHYEYSHCPTGDLWKSARCACDPVASIDHHPGSCLPNWERIEAQ